MRTDDRLALRAALVLIAVLIASQMIASVAAAASPGLVPGDYCQAADERREPWTAEQKARTRERINVALDALGVSEAVRAYHMAIVYRESFGGEASVRHRLGEDRDGVPEHGLGTHGLSLRWQAGKWGEDADPAFCSPEVSTVIAHEIMWRAVENYGARTLVEVQAVYGGSVTCQDGECRFRISPSRRRGLCSRLRARGVDCWAPVSAKDLGRRLNSSQERRRFALSLARAYVASWLGRLSLPSADAVSVGRAS